MEDLVSKAIPFVYILVKKNCTGSYQPFLIQNVLNYYGVCCVHDLTFIELPFEPSEMYYNTR